MLDEKKELEEILKEMENVSDEEKKIAIELLKFGKKADDFTIKCKK